MKNFIFLVPLLFVFASCSEPGIQKARQNSTVVFKDNGSASLKSVDAKKNSTTSADYKSASTTGDWCEFPAKRVFSFSCGQGNPGAGWTLQTDGCYHTVTSQFCSCQLPTNWLNQITLQCTGHDIFFKDPCGFQKKLENTVACGGSGTAGSLVSKLSCEEARFTKLINMYRQSKSLNPLTVSIAGVTASRWHAKDMIEKNYFSHTEPNGRSFSSRAAAFGFGGWAENIAAGNSDSAATFCQWKNSAGHNSNMLGSHSSMGIGTATGGGTYGSYWNNVFGSATDIIAEPLTLDPGCTMPTSIPGC